MDWIAKGKISVVWQIIFSFIPGVLIWSFFRFKKLTLFLAIICLLILITSAFTFINSYNLYGLQKVCIAVKCSEWVTENAWTATYCRSNELKTDIICDFMFEEQRVKMPLSELNTSLLKTCVAKECAVEVYIKSINVKEVTRK